jgi:LacI family transcriptional regulator
MISAMPPPSLSSVEVNYEQIGYKAAQILDGMMHQGDSAIGRTLIKPTGIIARDSTDFFAVDDEAVALGMRYIEQHTRESITVDDVATAAGVSRRTLERRFQSGTGRSVAAEIRRLRILKAKRLLAETDLLVKQIARETGFRDPIRLHEVFVREEGTTPSAYRKIVRGERTERE